MVIRMSKSFMGLPNVRSLTAPPTIAISCLYSSDSNIFLISLVALIKISRFFEIDGC